MIEAKGTGEDVREVARGEQVRRYLGRYGQVLVTNFRDFLLVGKGPDGEPVEGEGFRLAGSEAEFWEADVAKMSAARGEPFAEYLKRVMLHAFFLASYAREARARVEGGDLLALEGVRGALEEALGLGTRHARASRARVRALRAARDRQKGSVWGLIPPGKRV